MVGRPRRFHAYWPAVLLGVTALAFAVITTVVAFGEITTREGQASAAIGAALAERSAFVALIDEETGMRGYVATGSPAFLEPYLSGRAAYAAYRAAPPSMDEPNVTAALNRFAHSADALQPYFRAQIAAVERDRSRAAAALPAGKAAFDRLRADDARAVAALQNAIAEDRIATVKALDLARAAMIATGFVLLFAGAGTARVADSARASSALARRDPVTRLPNRRAFEERLAQVLANRGPDERIGVLYIDLDRFKAVNDQLGHAAGDDLLMLCGERMRRALRPDDFVARIGGDEFAAVLRPLVAAGDAGAIAARVVQEIEEPFVIGGTTVRLGASVGTAVVPDDGEDPAKIVQVADAAMYRVKRAGRR